MLPSMGTGVTLRTIADALGVSHTTVSNAFSRPDQLSDELRTRILETAARLGYRGPNPAARTLRRGRAGAVGVVLTESLTWALVDPYNVALLSGLAVEAEAARQSVLLIPSPPGLDQVTGVRSAVVDGFCVFTLPDGHPLVDEVLCRGVPTVFIDGPRIEGQPFVGVDDRGAMRSLTEHLVGLGHRSFGVLPVRLRPDDHVGWADAERIAAAQFRVTRERLAGVFAAVDAAGLGSDAVHVYEVGVERRHGARDAAVALLGRQPRPTALICFADQVALGALEALADLGLRAPDDVSVSGFDDIPAAALAGLTTIRQPGTGKGRAAGQLLTAAATAGDAPSGEDGPPEITLPHELVVRSTTGPPTA
jgi:DNA-binding LacI/PurR family transcriptional regulator